MFTTWNFSTLDEHNKIMVISSLFCWHLFFVVIFLFIQVWLIEICFDSSKNVMNSIAEMEQLDIQFNSLDQKPLRPTVQSFT